MKSREREGVGLPDSGDGLATEGPRRDSSAVEGRSRSPRDSEGQPRPGFGRYRGFPPVVIVDGAGFPRLAPFLMDDADLIDLFRLHQTRFPRATLNRYRRMGGLRGVRVGRRKYVRLDDALRFLDRQRDRQV
jgi:hypothetical protein